MKRGYGWRPDLPDRRDYMFSQFVSIGHLPSKIDLRKFCPPVEDQGRLGSCTANALVGNMEFLEVRNKCRFSDMSRLFVYYNERVLEDTVGYDSGATLRDGIKTLKKLGVCAEGICPYVISRFTEKPCARAYDDGLNHQIQAYMRLTSIGQMKRCLADGFPFVFGFSVYESFELPSVAKTGVVNMPGNDERVLGGHAVMAVGYNDLSKRFLVRNSWGSKWGMKGYFTMPYDYLDNRSLSNDFWTIRKAENV